MKRLILTLLPICLLAGCAPEPEKPLDPVTPTMLSAKLSKANSGLTSEDSTEVKSLSLPVEGSEATYSLEIGVPCYNHSTHDEIIMKPGAYFKSNSSYKVDRLIIDYFGTKGTNFDVFNNLDGSGEKLVGHESSVQPVDPTDGGKVLEYSIGGSEWIIKNNTEVNKPGFYSVTIVFTI